MTNVIPNLDSIEKSQCFPLYYYEKREKANTNLFDNKGTEEYIRHDGVSNYILVEAKRKYGESKIITKEDIFYYVYGLLHSKDYKENFAHDLKKILPKIPLVDTSKEFWDFSKAGKDLANLHVHYEDVAPYKGVAITGEETNNFTVDKMRFPKKGEKHTILYNGQIKIENIPEEAYTYVVNGKSAIEWIMERYQVTTHKDSGITNNPNDWCEEVGNPRYILDLLLSVMNLSIESRKIIDSLPKLDFS
jgi:predicted helicase